MKKIIVLFVGFASVLHAQTLQLQTDSLALALEGVSSVAGCSQHANTVKSAAAYYLYSPYSETDVVRGACQQVVMLWATNTADLHLSISPNMHQGLVDKKVKQGELLTAYIAAAVYYAINEGVKETTLEAYVFAMEETLLYYSKNKQNIGKSSYWEKLLKMKEEKRLAEFTKLYNEDNPSK